MTPRRGRSRQAQEPAPWDDPARPSYWITRMVHAPDPMVLTALLDELRRRWPDSIARRNLEEQIERTRDARAARN